MIAKSLLSGAQTPGENNDLRLLFDACDRTFGAGATIHSNRLRRSLIVPIACSHLKLNGYIEDLCIHVCGCIFTSSIYIEGKIYSQQDVDIPSALHRKQQNMEIWQGDAGKYHLGVEVLTVIRAP